MWKHGSEFVIVDIMNEIYGWLHVLAFSLVPLELMFRVVEATEQPGKGRHGRSEAVVEQEL